MKKDNEKKKKKKNYTGTENLIFTSVCVCVINTVICVI